MQRKIESEIKNLENLGIPEDYARLITYAKYGYKDAAEDILNEVKETQDEISELVKHFVPFHEVLAEQKKYESEKKEAKEEAKEEVKEVKQDFITFEEVDDSKNIVIL